MKGVALRSENLQKHRRDIESRPAKEWFISNKEKQKLQRDDKMNLDAIEAKRQENNFYTGMFLF